MAPKPTAKPVAAGKKPTGAISAKGKADAKTPSSGDAGAAGDESPTTMAAPKNKEEVLAQAALMQDWAVGTLDAIPDEAVAHLTLSRLLTHAKDERHGQIGRLGGAVAGQHGLRSQHLKA